MNQKEITNEFIKIGWRKSGTVYIHPIEDRIAQISPRLKSLPEREKLLLSPSVSLTSFQDAIKEISKIKKTSTPMVVDFRENDTVYANTFTPEIIKRTSTSILEWAQKQKLEEIMLQFCEIPTDSAGDQPLKHLAALALLGETQRLQSYKENFSQGDRMGFVPFITEDFIDRALAISKKKNSLQ